MILSLIALNFTKKQWLIKNITPSSRVNNSSTLKQNFERWGESDEGYFAGCYLLGGSLLKITQWSMGYFSPL
ncbi:hypothetical protein [Psychrobacter ciconiae]|uniref:hypothetical protein n=1 Tax=Psychrobacter ciconiae TaxID=1553449 RepID=UPI00191B59E1|nr:hypothetical protein [Psychrobacter ciconiae]